MISMFSFFFYTNYCRRGICSWRISLGFSKILPFAVCNCEIVLFSYLCFSKFRKYAVFFSPSSTHSALDLLCYHILKWLSFVSYKQVNHQPYRCLIFYVVKILNSLKNTVSLCFGVSLQLIDLT